MSSQTSTAPKKATIFPNGTAQTQTQPTPATSPIDKLLLANTTLAVWLIFLAIGGGILALYYARIDYLPEAEWKAALIYLFIGSVVGGAIGLLLTISLFIPGVLWSQFIIHDPCLDFSYTALPSEVHSKKSRPELCIRSVVYHLGGPFLGFLVVSHVVLLAGKRAFWPVAFVILAATFLSMRAHFNHLLAKGSCEAAIISRHSFKYAAWFTLSVLLSQISMYVIYWLSGTPGVSPWLEGHTPQWKIFTVLTVLCTAGVWLSNHAVAALYQGHRRGAVVAALVTAGLLLFTADNFSSLSVKLMNRYGIGYYQRFNLLITTHGEEVVNALGVPKCGTQQLCNVEILSKVGDQYYLRVGDQTYVTLAKSEVVSIRRLN